MIIRILTAYSWQTHKTFYPLYRRMVKKSPPTRNNTAISYPFFLLAFLIFSIVLVKLVEKIKERDNGEKKEKRDVIDVILLFMIDALLTGCLIYALTLK